MILTLVMAALLWPLDSAKLPKVPAATQAEIAALKLDTLPRKKELDPILDVHLPLEEGSSMQLLGELKKGPLTLVVVRLDEEAAMMSVSYTFVLVRNPQGAWVDGVQLASAINSEAGELTETGLLTEGRALTRTTKSRIPMHEEGLPVELVVRAETKGVLTGSGKFELKRRVTTTDGAFLDGKTGEEIRVFGDDVFYRGNESKPFQKLLRQKNEVRFTPDGKPYALSWSATNEALSSRGPDGKVQTFVREW
jgi:hypothetical protein